MLTMEVAFLTGRYVATAYNTRQESEWPPHPARLFSALVAAHFAADARLTPDHAEERAALEWLERQGPPSIRASDASSRDLVTVFVPVNDEALTKVDDEAHGLETAREDLAAARHAGDAKAVKEATTAVRKADAILAKAIARGTGVPSRAIDPRLGRRVLPEFRTRQPRTFPSVTPAEPSVYYVWPGATPSPDQAARLDALLRRVVRMGHSSSLVSIRLVPEAPSPTWHPDSDGDLTLRVVEAGQFSALAQAFERHHEVEPRVMPAVSQAYSRVHLATGNAPPRSVFSDDWLVLRRVGGPALPMTATAGVARALRRTLLSFATEPIAEVLSGHAPDGRPSENVHLAVVPLPFVGHQHARGAILGVALVLPRASDPDMTRHVYSAVARWEAEHRQEDEDIPSVRLNLGSAGELLLERIEWGVSGAVQSSLRPSVWCGPAMVWYSVTPVALDRNPGDLRSRDSGKLAAALAEAAEVTSRACERIGLPRPRVVEILPAALWAGSSKARSYPAFPGDSTRTQRVLTHCRIEFDRPVRGPVLVGSGRFLGLGLLRPGDSR